MTADAAAARAAAFAAAYVRYRDALRAARVGVDEAQAAAVVAAVACASADGDAGVGDALSWGPCPVCQRD